MFSKVMVKMCGCCRSARQCVSAGGHLLARAHHPDDVPDHWAGHAEGRGPGGPPQGLPLFLLPRQAHATLTLKSLATHFGPFQQATIAIASNAPQPYV